MDFPIVAQIPYMLEPLKAFYFQIYTITLLHLISKKGFHIQKVFVGA